MVSDLNDLKRTCCWFYRWNRSCICLLGDYFSWGLEMMPICRNCSVGSLAQPVHFFTRDWIAIDQPFLFFMFLIELPVKNFLFPPLPIFVRVMGIIHATPHFNCELPFMFFAMNTWWKLVWVQYFCLEVMQVRLAFYLQYIASCVYYRLNHTRLVCKTCYSIYTSGIYHICRFRVRSSPCDFFF